MPSEVHFTRAQKWDLVRLAAAAVASTVFFTVPMFLVHPRGSASQVEDSQSAPVATTGDRDGSAATLPPVVTASKSTPDTDVSVVNTMEFAMATTPRIEFPSAAMQTRATKPAQLRARANTTAPNPSTSSFGRRVARFFAGTGKYDVKPFPTVTTSGS
jgi:hypothetical protein